MRISVAGELTSKFVLERAPGVDDEHRHHLKHIDVQALLEPLLVVQLDFLVHLSEDSVFEFLVYKEKRLVVLSPSLKHLVYHLWT